MPLAPRTLTGSMMLTAQCTASCLWPACDSFCICRWQLLPMSVCRASHAALQLAAALLDLAGPSALLTPPSQARALGLQGPDWTPL